MRFLLLVLISISLFNCASRKAIQRTAVAHSRTFPIRQLQSSMADTISLTGIEVKPGIALPTHTEVVRAGFFMLPLLFYNHFQSSYQVLLGQDVLDGSWQDHAHQRLRVFANQLASNGITNVKVELNKAMANGKYVSGHAYVVIPAMYTSMMQDINLSKSKNATAELSLRLSWTDASSNEDSRDASIKIKVDKGGVYSAQVRTLLGKTVNLSANDINFHFTHDVISQPPYFVNEPFLTVHLFRLSDLLILGLDELCEVVLQESREEEIKILPPSYAVDLQRAKTLLWEQLRGKKLGKRFSRGGGSFYDFTSRQAELTIDVGLERKTFSVERYLFSLGQSTSSYNHIYFSPDEILNNMNGVLEKIRQELK